MGLFRAHSVKHTITSATARPRLQFSSKPLYLHAHWRQRTNDRPEIPASGVPQMQFLALIAIALLAIVQPQSTSQRVHDFANLLSPEQRQSLENLSRDVERKTTAEIGDRHGQLARRPDRRDPTHTNCFKSGESENGKRTMACCCWWLQMNAACGSRPALASSPSDRLVCAAKFATRTSSRISSGTTTPGASWPGPIALADILLANPAGAAGRPEFSPRSGPRRPETRHDGRHRSRLRRGRARAHWRGRRIHPLLCHNFFFIGNLDRLPSCSP